MNYYSVSSAVLNFIYGAKKNIGKTFFIIIPDVDKTHFCLSSIFNSNSQTIF